ncbi:hypothetical protein C8R44DRAFT_862876 [Mycena epipterygia]|nr:hypothetical protein C8R44DRAFT_862876 [Mycena epipterygia]
MQFTKCLASLAALVAVVAAQNIDAQATFYEPNGSVGKCGTVIQNSDLAVAVSPYSFANGAHCGETIAVEHDNLVDTFKVEDECVTCKGNNIALTSGGFQIFAPLSAGVINVTYTSL